MLRKYGRLPYEAITESPAEYKELEKQLLALTGEPHLLGSMSLKDIKVYA